MMPAALLHPATGEQPGGPDIAPALPGVALCRYVELAPDHGPHVDGAAEEAEAACLSPDELARAQSLRFASHRSRFVAAHAALRRCLADASGLPAATLQLVYGPLGKPVLAGQPGLRFSLSHSGALALVAIGHGAPLGADVECLRPLPELLPLARRCLTPREFAALVRLPQAQRAQAFLTAWTRKEACLKAVGLGLHWPPHQLEVGLAPVVQDVRIDLAGHALSLQVGPAPARAGCVASLARWQAPQSLFDQPDVLAQLLERLRLRTAPRARQLAQEAA